MRRHVFASTLAMLTVVAAFPQADEWGKLMDAGIAAEIAGDYAKASSLYGQLTEMSDRLDPHDARRAYAWNSRAKTDDILGRFAEAETGYRHALKAAEESLGKSNFAYAMVLENLATMYVETGQAARGEKLSREALAIHCAIEPRNEVRTAVAQNCLGTILAMCGKPGESRRLTEAALPVLEKHPEAWMELAVALNSMGVAYFADRNYPEAERVLVKGATLIEQHAGADHPMLIRMLCNLASVQVRTARREEARLTLRRALNIAETRLGADHPMYGIVLASYAGYLRQAGDKSQAKALEAKSMRIMRDSGRRNGLGAVIDITALQRK